MNKEPNYKNPPAPILVLGMGNILMTDEGIGVRVIESLKECRIPSGVELFDGGTASLELLSAFSNRKKLIVVDAIKGGQNPGAVYRFNFEDLTYQKEFATSLHQLGIIDTLSQARILDCLPEEVIIIGIEPAKIAPGLELSSEMAAVIPKIKEIILKELA
jgi:hydrogenase maturation protease